MPTVLREGPYRYYFYASDREEPPHVHVERDVHQLARARRGRHYRIKPPGWSSIGWKSTVAQAKAGTA